MPTYRQLALFSQSAPSQLPSSGEVFAMPAGRCDICETERLCILTHRRDYSLHRDVPVWGCLDCSSYCEAGEHLADTDSVSFCSECDACSECCDCPYCEGCSETVRETESCGLCSQCCECYVCRRCPSGNDHVGPESWFCSDCECCESCCDCIRCNYCGELTDQTCEDHGYCSGCCDDCGIGADETDMEDLRNALADVPAYVPGAASTIGPYTFGVELEHNGNGVRACREIISAMGMRGWSAKEDGSLHSSTGAEVVSPILRGEDGIAQMRTMMLALSANGGTVNHECGTHVHIGAADMEPADIVRLVRFYDRNVALIDSLHPQSRRNAFYCGNTTPREIDSLDHFHKGNPSDKKALADATGSRYRKVNLHSLRWHGTIEFRQHAGTLNPRKLEAWIRFLMALCECARFSSADGTYSTLPELLGSLRPFGLGEEHIAYLLNRSLKLGAA